MLSGDFERKLRKLNNNIRIFCLDSNKAAGIFTVCRGEYTEICGIDKNYIPERTIYDPETGRILKGGFRRALKVLIGKGYIDRKEAEKAFSLSFEYKVPKFKYSSPSLRQKLMAKGISVMEEQSGNYTRSRILP